MTSLDQDEDDCLLELSDDERVEDSRLPEEGGSPQEGFVSNTHRDLPKRCVETIRLEQAPQQSEYTYEAKAHIPK